MPRTARPAAPGRRDRRRARRWSSGSCWPPCRWRCWALFTTPLAAGLTAVAILPTPSSTRWGSSAGPGTTPSSAALPGRGAGADRLGRGDRLAGLAGPGLLRGRLLLAAAALLGAGQPVPRRLRPGRRADAVRGAPGRTASAGSPSPGRGRPSARRCCMGSVTPVLGWAFAVGGRGSWAPGTSPRPTPWLGRIRSGVPDRPMRVFSCRSPR